MNISVHTFGRPNDLMMFQVHADIANPGLQELKDLAEMNGIAVRSSSPSGSVVLGPNILGVDFRPTDPTVTLASLMCVAEYLELDNNAKNNSLSNGGFRVEEPGLPGFIDNYSV